MFSWAACTYTGAQCIITKHNNGAVHAEPPSQVFCTPMLPSRPPELTSPLTITAVIPPQMIDEVHTLIGAGAAEGAIDAANILKPALARGDLQCIGATTMDEYRKHIEKDPALER